MATTIQNRIQKRKYSSEEYEIKWRETEALNKEISEELNAANCKISKLEDKIKLLEFKKASMLSIVRTYKEKVCSLESDLMIAKYDIQQNAAIIKEAEITVEKSNLRGHKSA